MKATITAVALSTLSSRSWADATLFALPSASSLTRAEVIAAIQAPSSVSHHGDAVVFETPHGSSLTRAEVLAEAQADRASGRFHGDSATLRFEFDAAKADTSRQLRMAEADRLTRVR